MVMRAIIVLQRFELVTNSATCDECNCCWNNDELSRLRLELRSLRQPEEDVAEKPPWRDLQLNPRSVFGTDSDGSKKRSRTIDSSAHDSIQVEVESRKRSADTAIEDIDP